MSHLPPFCGDCDERHELDGPVVRIRKSLQASRDKGLAFNDAWEQATTKYQDSDDDRTLMGFMREHFRAAYYNTEAPKGRFRPPEPETSGAIVAGFLASPRELVTVSVDRCRSGDGCDRLATRGRFGPMFCEHHGAELKRISDEFWAARRRADPRVNGNTVLYTHRAA